MSERRISARFFLIIAAAGLAFAAILVIYAVVRQAITSVASDPAESAALIGALRRALIPATILLLVLFIAAAVVITQLWATPLRRLRSELSDLVRGDRIYPITSGWFSEHADLSQSVGHLVAELRAQQQRTETERAELANLLESGTEGLLQISPQGRIVHVNAAGSQLLGLPPQPRGQPVAALVRQADLRELIQQATAGETPEPRELLLDDRQLVVIAKPARPDGGAIVAIIDLTEVRRLEAVRRDFVANVSHELKTPLTSIRGYTETLLNDDVPPELRAQFLDVISKNASRIQRIVDDLLDLSRLQSGGWRPEVQDVDAAELAEDVWATCRAAVRKHIDFEVVASGSAHVAADPAGLRQVFSNLFDNALRYTPEGGRVLVRINQPRRTNGNAPAPQQWVNISVQDNGIGIPREALPRIFERFYRVDPARSRAEGGTGLGLSIVKHLLERMDGEVAADSELGKGTTIRIRLPAA